MLARSMMTPKCHRLRHDRCCLLLPRLRQCERFAPRGVPLVVPFSGVCRKPVITSPTSPISSLRTLATRTSPSCSTRTPLSPTLRFSPSTKPRTAKIHGAWCYSSFEAFFAALLSQAPLRSRFALYTSTMSWPRNVTLPLISYDGYMAT